MVAALLGLIGWKWLPSDEQAIHKHMARLAEAASVKPDESNFAKLAYADRLTGFFTTNAVLRLEGLSRDFPVISSRADLREAAMAARAYLRRADFRVADVLVRFPEDKRQATARVVIVGQINDQTNHFGQAFQMALEKQQGRWLIAEVQTVEGLR